MSAPPLPPGVSARDFQSALAAFAVSVGPDAVLSSSATQEAYLDPFAPGDAHAWQAAAVVMPSSVEQVRAVLGVANRYRVPLWTVSTGRNFAYGGASPRLAGSVVLDLQRMNRILDIDEKLAYALVEPGVSYYDLYRVLKARGARLWLDPPAAGWGSVIGNTLERGYGTTSYGDHASMQCGLEVVLANGEVVRTGMGAMSASRDWQVFKPGFGPSYDAMFMQSNFGVVTKLGVWLMPEPEGYLLARYAFKRDDDLERIVDTLRPLKLDDTIQSSAVIESAVRWAAGVSTRKQWYDGPGAMPEAAIDAMARKIGIGRWNLRFCLYGPQALVNARRDIIHQRFSPIADAVLFELPYREAAVEPKGGGDRSQVGIPGLEAFNLLNWRGGSGAHVDFSPVCPPSGRDAVKQYRMVRDRAAQAGFDYYGGFTASQRHMHHVFAAIFDRDDLAQARNAGALIRALIEDAGAAGYGQYRTHLAYMDLAAAQYDFNDHALMHLTNTIKQALDPNGILSPGKQGIWPARFGEHDR
ncbi:FAD linked oxidase domain-containing protein [Caballeronia choica]|uniref:FAD linked oxidase domain-containing protein n=1 Tax=Caballeronia choica TaxID=326476 RepID=A0A158GBA4_9BURK|nr:FAD-binding oxidoreductase [Caballeronia choica]SAL29404.1 FAD linked oxidase domain-containing protein [Caballeronia choica]